MNDQSDDDISFKVILVGDQGVGKSSIMIRYVHNEFRADYNVTIGVEFSSKSVIIDEDTCVKLQIWDTVIFLAGQESFRSIIRSFYRGTKAAFFVYQINKRETFLNIKGWLEEVRENTNSNTILVLMGNQCDQPEIEREVSFEEGEAFMKENGIHFFFETSARDGNQIDCAFEEAAKMIFVNYITEMAKVENQSGNEDELNEINHKFLNYKTLKNNKNRMPIEDSVNIQNKKCC